MSEATAHEIWNVQLGPGRVRPMTLDEIDAAFEAGHISGSTLVLPPGKITWVTLGDAAGLDSQVAPSETPAPVVTELSPSSLAPMAISASSAHLESLVPPPPVLYEPEDDFEAAHKRSRIKLIAGGVGVLALIAALGAVGARIANQTESAVNTAAAGPPLRETKLSELGDEGPGGSRVLSDEQKKRLDQADKARAAAAAAAAAKRRDSQPPRRTPYKGDDPFKKSSGNKYDPLNGSL